MPARRLLATAGGPLAPKAASGGHFETESQFQKWSLSATNLVVK